MHRRVVDVTLTNRCSLLRRGWIMGIGPFGQSSDRKLQAKKKD
jgi:hypothetical protein